MLIERDPEIQRLEIQRSRQENTRQDRQLLMNSWRALARSHRLLDRPFYRAPQQGQLTFVLKPPRST
jgi:hypothetical protein